MEVDLELEQESVLAGLLLLGDHKMHDVLSYLLFVFLLLVAFIFAERITIFFARFWKNYPFIRNLPESQFTGRRMFLKWGFRWGIIVILFVSLIIFVLERVS
jgi:hypothetical protein